MIYGFLSTTYYGCISSALSHGCLCISVGQLEAWGDLQEVRKYFGFGKCLFRVLVQVCKRVQASWKGLEPKNQALRSGRFKDQRGGLQCFAFVLIGNDFHLFF